MNESPSPAPLKPQDWLVIAATALAAGAIFWLARASGVLPGWAAVMAAFILLAVNGWWFALSWRKKHLALQRHTHRQMADLQAHQREQNHRLAEGQRRLDLVLDFNRSLVEARDERALVDSALSAIGELVGALGSSFVPVDEWEQPLPAFTFGQLPEPVLRAWAEHLAGAMLRERCGDCTVLHSTPGGCPLHPQSIGNSLSVFCLPMRRRDLAVQPGRIPADGPAARTLGMLNLYLPAGRTLDEETARFLEGFLQQLAMAIETARLRDQELVTLRQIQMLHAPEGGLSDSLQNLLENLQQALEADTVWLRLRTSPDERLSGLQVKCGPAPHIDPVEIERVFERVLQGQVMRSEDYVAGGGDWLALPMRLPEGQVPGMLLVGRSEGPALHPRHEAILHTVAAQAALLVENERMLRSLEYRAVIQERTRLAREIHDGLAQTLAFLKLQAAQMQSYLAQGDMSRLSQVLKDNYQVLAEAYLDTRQAIDNLRLTPQRGLESSLEQVAVDFEATTGLTIERSLQSLSSGWLAAMTPEIQAQLVRIAQEALNNVRKHARAHHAWINLREWQGELVLEIGDDGLGFDADDVPEISQHGLRGMRERAEMIGADFQIISQTRQGTLVHLALPAYKEMFQ